MEICIFCIDSLLGISTSEHHAFFRESFGGKIACGPPRPAPTTLNGLRVSHFIMFYYCRLKGVTHLAILYAGQTSPSVPGSVITIFADRRDRRIKSPGSGMLFTYCARWSICNTVHKADVRYVTRKVNNKGGFAPSISVHEKKRNKDGLFLCVILAVYPLQY